MPKNRFYTATIFSLTLALITGLIQSILYLLLNTEIFRLPPFGWWFLLVNLINLASSILILKYLHAQRLGIAFIQGMLSTIAGVTFAAVFYIVVIERQLQQIYFPALILVIITALIYGSGLILTRAGDKKWLKAAGISILTLGLALVALLTVTTLYPDYMNKIFLREIDPWMELVGNLPLVFLIMHFRSESKTSKNENVQIHFSTATQGLLNYGALIASTFTLVLSIWMIKETFHTLY